MWTSGPVLTFLHFIGFVMESTPRINVRSTLLPCPVAVLTGFLVPSASGSMAWPSGSIGSEAEWRSAKLRELLGASPSAMLAKPWCSGASKARRTDVPCSEQPRRPLNRQACPPPLRPGRRRPGHRGLPVRPCIRALLCGEISRDLEWICDLISEIGSSLDWFRWVPDATASAARPFENEGGGQITTDAQHGQQVNERLLRFHSRSVRVSSKKTVV